MKHYFKKTSKIIFSLALLLSLSTLASCSKTPDTSVISVKTTPAIAGNLVSQERIAATIQGENTAPISFKVGGRILEISAQVGQSVKKGQVLAKLSTEEASIAVEGYSNVLGVLASTDAGSILSALESMKKSTSELYESRISSTKTEVDSAQIRVKISESELALSSKNLENMKKVLSGSLTTAGDREAQAQAGLEYAKNQLSNTEKLLASQEETLYKGGLAALSNTFILARGSKEFADMFLGISVENKSKNDAFENILDTFAKNRAENEYMKFEKVYTETHDWYFANISDKKDVSRATTKEGLEKAIVTLESLRTVLYAIQDILEKTTPSTQFDATTINSYKTRTSEMLAGIESALLSTSGGGTKGVLEQMIAFEKESTLKVQSLQDGVILAEKNLVLAQSGKDVSESSNKKDIDLLQAEVAIKKDALEAVKNSVKQTEQGISVLNSEKKAKISELDSKISELRVQIAQTNMQTKLSKAQLSNHVLTAPFDGVIIEQVGEVGMMVQAGAPVFVISSGVATKVVSSIVDLKLLAGGIENSRLINTEILLENAAGNTLTGTISSVSSVKNPKNNSFPFEVKIPLQKELPVGEKIWILIGSRDRSDQSISGNTSSGVKIPVDAIVGKYSIPSVFVYKEGVVNLRQVRILEKNTDFVLVDGVQVAEEIVTFGKENCIDRMRVMKE